MTITITKYVEVLAGIGGTPAEVFEAPTFDTVFPALLLGRGGPLLLTTGAPLLLEDDDDG